jgi:hypothetical protein
MTGSMRTDTVLEEEEEEEEESQPALQISGIHDSPCEW